MAWLWWLLAPVASTGVGAVVIWWRGPTGAGRRLRRTDAVTEHQALLRALAQHPPVSNTPRASATPKASATPRAGVLLHAAVQPTAEQSAAEPPAAEQVAVGQVAVGQVAVGQPAID
jgi:hypothetical protein